MSKPGRLGESERARNAELAAAVHLAGRENWERTMGEMLRCLASRRETAQTGAPAVRRRP